MIDNYSEKMLLNKIIIICSFLFACFSIVFGQNQPYIGDYIVNDDIRFNSQSEPLIGGYPEKGVQIGWRDNRGLNERYFARKYRANGIAYGNDQQTTFSQESANESDMLIIMNQQGKTVNVWTNRRFFYSQIWHRVYDSTGVSLSSSAPIDNPDIIYSNQSNPAATFFPDGKMAVVWRDDRDSSDYIYGRFFNPQFTPYREALQLSPAFEQGEISSIKIIPLTPNKYVLCWLVSGPVAGHDRIYGKVANFGADTLAQTVLLYNAESSSSFSDLWIARHDTSSFLLSYCIHTPNGKSVVFQKYNNQLGTIDSMWTGVSQDNISPSSHYTISYSSDQTVSMVNESDAGTFRLHRWTSGGVPVPVEINFNPENEDELGYEPQIFSENSLLTFAWIGIDSVGRSDIFSRQYFTNGTPAGPRVRVNTDLTNTDQEHPALRMLPDNNLLFAYSDSRLGYPVTYMLVGDSLGRNLIESIPVPADTSGEIRQWTPSLDVNSSGKFAIAWRDERNFNPDIYFRIFETARQPVTVDMPAHVFNPQGFQRNPDIAIDESGRIIVVWEDERFGDNDVYVNVFDSQGHPLVEEVPSDVFADTLSQTNPHVSMITADVALIVWQDERDGNPDIYGRFWSTSNGQPVGGSFRVNEDIGISRQQSPAVCGDRNGLAVVAFTDDHTGNARSDIFLKYYTLAGAVDTAFCATRYDDPREHSQLSVALSIDGYTVVTWRDRRLIDPDIYALEIDGTTVFDEYVIYQVNSGGQPAPGDQRYPVAALNGHSIVYAWTDDRNSAVFGADITANIRYRLNQLAVNDKPNRILPEEFALSSIYPNPFNSSVNFSLLLPNTERISLKIYDLLGREIETIYSGILSAGSHEFYWTAENTNGQSLASGMYFLQVKSNTKLQTKKLLYLK